MELERTHRFLELAMCAMWFGVFTLRIRSLRIGESGVPIVPPLRAAIAPIRWSTWAVIALSGPLWLESATQPFAHALFVPTILAAGIAESLARICWGPTTKGVA